MSIIFLNVCIFRCRKPGIQKKLPVGLTGRANRRKLIEHNKIMVYWSVHVIRQNSLLWDLVMEKQVQGWIHFQYVCRVMPILVVINLYNVTHTMNLLDWMENGICTNVVFIKPYYMSRTSNRMVSSLCKDIYWLWITAPYETLAETFHHCQISMKGERSWE